MLASVPEPLRKNIDAFYAAAPGKMSSKKERKRADTIRKQLALLNNAKDTKAKP